MSPRLLVIALALCLSAGCKKKANTPIANAGDRSQPIDRASDTNSGDDDGGTATVNGGDGATDLPFTTLYFEFDSATLTGQSRTDLQRVASWLGQHADGTLTIEGHCDERGTTEYNVALGQRRAQAIQDYLVHLGVPSARLATISYGEERPVVTGEAEDAYARNRRGELVPPR